MAPITFGAGTFLFDKNPRSVTLRGEEVRVGGGRVRESSRTAAGNALLPAIHQPSPALKQEASDSKIYSFQAGHPS